MSKYSSKLMPPGENSSHEVPKACGPAVTAQIPRRRASPNTSRRAARAKKSTPSTRTVRQQTFSRTLYGERRLIEPREVFVDFVQEAHQCGCGFRIIRPGPKHRQALVISKLEQFAFVLWRQIEVNGRVLAGADRQN